MSHLKLCHLLQYTTSGKSLPKVELADDMCAVCGQRIILPTADSPEATERTYRLSCRHLYPSCSLFMNFARNISPEGP